MNNTVLEIENLHKALVIIKGHTITRSNFTQYNN